MDPRLLKLMGYTFQTPYAGDDGEDGGGDNPSETEDGDEEDEEDSEDDDEEEDEDEDDEDSEDGDDDEEDEEDSEDGDEEEDEDSEDEDEDEEDGKLGHRAQKRIKKLVGENKDLKRQLKEAQELGGEDGQAILSAATKAGIAPRLMSKELANGLNELAEKKDALGYFKGLLDSDEDEFEIGGKQYSRRQLERKERTLTEEVHALESKFGKGRDKALEEAKTLFELGWAAKKAGWKPEGGSGKAKKKKHDKPKHKASHKKGGAHVESSYDGVEDDDSLEAMIAKQRRKKGR